MRAWQLALWVTIGLLISVTFGIAVTYFSYIEWKIDHQESANCAITGCLILSNQSCYDWSDLPCSTYNFNYSTVINGITYHGNIIDDWYTGGCWHLPYIIKCYYQDTQNPPVFKLHGVNEGMAIPFLVFSTAFMIVFPIMSYVGYQAHCKNDYIEIKN